MAWFDLKTRLAEGDALEVFFPGQYESMQTTAGKILHRSGEHAVLSGGVGEVGMKLPFSFPENAFLARALSVTSVP